ncbi:hypothetical protein ABW19_dt0202486 [Dactylella cylindrospora]|nr:hypothetical protein ABW19_dt0202486 [Dactylella cylindrospora]
MGHGWCLIMLFSFFYDTDNSIAILDTIDQVLKIYQRFAGIVTFSEISRMAIQIKTKSLQGERCWSCGKWVFFCAKLTQTPGWLYNQGGERRRGCSGGGDHSGSGGWDERKLSDSFAALHDAVLLESCPQRTPVAFVRNWVDVLVFSRAL